MDVTQSDDEPSALEPRLRFPGDELIEAGVNDLAVGRVTPAACVVSLASRRLAALGVCPASRVEEPERRLYALLEAELGRSAHSRYNALVRQVVSYCVAREQDARRLQRSDGQPLPAGTR